MCFTIMFKLLQPFQIYCIDNDRVCLVIADVECPGMFHCPGSYCVPYRKLCDGVRDCPQGHDEVDCQQYTCPGELSSFSL